MDVYFLICQDEDYGLTYKGIPFKVQRIVKCIPTTLEECPMVAKEYKQLPLGVSGGYVRIVTRDEFTSIEVEDTTAEFSDGTIVDLRESRRNASELRQQHEETLRGIIQHCTAEYAGVTHIL